MKKPFHNSFVYMAIPSMFSQSPPIHRRHGPFTSDCAKKNSSFLLFSSDWPISEAERKRGRERLAFTLTSFNPRRVVWCYFKSSQDLWLSKGHENQPFSQFSFMLLWPNVCELLHLHAPVGAMCSWAFQGASCKLQATDLLMLSLPGDIGTDHWRFEILTSNSPFLLAFITYWASTYWHLSFIMLVCFYVVRICYFQHAQHFGQPRLFLNTE